MEHLLGVARKEKKNQKDTITLRFLVTSIYGNNEINMLNDKII